MAKHCTKLQICTGLTWKITKILKTKKSILTMQKSVFSSGIIHFWLREKCVKDDVKPEVYGAHLGVKIELCKKFSKTFR